MLTSYKRHTRWSAISFLERVENNNMHVYTYELDIESIKLFFGNPLWLSSSYAPAQIKKIENIVQHLEIFEKLGDEHIHVFYIHVEFREEMSFLFYAKKDKITDLKRYSLNLIILVTGFVFFTQSSRNVISSRNFKRM